MLLLQVVERQTSVALDVGALLAGLGGRIVIRPRLLVPELFGRFGVEAAMAA